MGKMKDRKHSPVAAILLLLAACVSIAGIHHYLSGFVHVNGTRYDKSATTLDLSGESLTRLDELRLMPELKRLDLRGTGLTAAQYEALQAQLPNCEILWDIPFQGSTYPQDTKKLTVTGLTDEDVAVLDHLPELEYVFAWDCTDYDQLMELRRRHPDCTVYYSVDIGGQTYSHRTTRITTPGDDPETLARLFSYLPELEAVTLVLPLAEVESLRTLQASFPDVDIRWQLDIGGILADETTTELDLTGIPLTAEQIESLFPYMPNLTYVDMSDCGISNEDMDALNRRHEDIKIVWTVTLGSWYRTKTDITWFMPVKHGFYPRGNDLYNLRYCTDVICLDIGHMKVTNCDFVAYMPHLQYLLLADTRITDITPLTGLTELIYLELFMTGVTDYSPLLTLTSLEDLNLHYTNGDPEIIAQMTWLKNLWWRSQSLGWSDMEMLRDTLVNTNYQYSSRSSTGGGWRELPNYYAQRDILGMRYMTG